MIAIVATGCHPSSESRADAGCPVRSEEATIASVHAFKAKQLTAIRRRAVSVRIAQFDKTGPALNAVTVTNPKALDEADALDRRYATGGLTGPLHCVPVVVKDNYETIGLQSANGSKSLEGFVSDRDAFLVKRIKAAGAIVIAKTNMAEFAFSPYETLSSIQGQTKNPYALDRVPAGSSGGTAAAVSANLALAGLGSDTGNSIRGPSSHTALAGIRSTMGLTSRAGVMPLSYLADVAGPMARTVTDAVTIFQVIVGEDPDDAMTARARGRPIPNYLASLVPDGLRGARIGVLTQAYVRDTLDAEITDVFARVEGHGDGGRDDRQSCDDRSAAPHRRRGSGILRHYTCDACTLRAVPRRDRRVGQVRSVERAQAAAGRAEHTAGTGERCCTADTAYRRHRRGDHDDGRAAPDALVYPTWSNPPRVIGDHLASRR